MKISLLPFAAALGIGILTTSCHHRHHPVYHHPAGTGSHYRVGYQVRALPPRYQTLNYAGTRYYYHDNVYYRPYGSGYIVVDNPRVPSHYYASRRPVANVTVIRTLPRGYRVVNYGGVRYYHYGDTFYQPTGGGYQIVASPYGVRRRGWR